jgi:hypothetical protein
MCPTFFISVNACLIGWIFGTLLCCSARPPQDRRDPPRPGGRHRSQWQGKQIKDRATTIIDHGLMSICYEYHVEYVVVVVDYFPHPSRCVDILRAEILLDESVWCIYMGCINMMKYLCFLSLIVWVHIRDSSCVEWSLRNSGYAHR